MKIWIIRGKYDYEALREYYEKYPLRKSNDYQHGQYLYWARKSNWEGKEVTSIQTNKPSATRAFKRAKQSMELSFRKHIVDIELVELDITLPGGE